MKLRAITTINYNHKLMEPGKVFECDEEHALPLIAIGAAEAVTAREKPAPTEK